MTPEQALIETLAKAAETAMAERNRRIARPPIGHGMVLSEPTNAMTATVAVLRALAEAGCTEEMSKASSSLDPFFGNGTFKAAINALLADEEKQG